MGVFAGSSDSYTTFEPLFRPIIQDYHDYDGSKRTDSNLDFTEWQFPEWTKERVTKVYGIQMRISRNLKDFPFGTTIETTQRAEIEQTMSNILKNFAGPLKGFYTKIEDLKEIDIERLESKGVMLRGNENRFLKDGGLTREWPQNRGIFTTLDKKISIQINEEDHIRIISSVESADFKEAFSGLAMAATLL